MIKELILLSSVGMVTYAYNSLLMPQLTEIIGINNYNLISTFIIIITQIDNFSLFYDLQKKKEITNDLNDNKMNERYLKIISNQLSFICRKQEELQKQVSINNNKANMVILASRHSKSYNDLNEI